MSRAIALLCGLAGCLPFAATAQTEQRPWHYVIGSSANVREEPRSDSRTLKKLEIGDALTVERVNGEWAVVNGGLGWVRRDLIGERAPRFDELWESYQRTPREDLPGRTKWLERAVALEPTNVPAWDALAGVYEDAGDKARAEQAHREAEFLRNPDAFVDPGEPRVVFLYREETIQPLALVQKGQLARVYDNQEQLDRFVSRYFRAGRRYRLHDGNAEIGSATVLRNGRPGEIRLDECRNALGAAVRPAMPSASGAKRLVVATNRPMGPRQWGAERVLTAEEKAAVARLSARFLLQVLLPPGNIYGQREVEARKRASRLPPAVSGVALDLDGDGGEELVGISRFAKKSRDPDNEFGAVLLLVLKDGPSGRRVPIYHWGEGSYGDRIPGMKLLGFADLNGDGLREIITEEQGYERHGTRIHVGTRAPGSAITYKDSNVGNWGGC